MRRTPKLLLKRHQLSVMAGAVCDLTDTAGWIPLAGWVAMLFCVPELYTIAFSYPEWVSA
jgi:hypothetical protein